MLNQEYVEDIILHEPNSSEKNILNQIKFSEKKHYRYKKIKNTIFYLADDLNSQKPIVSKTSGLKKRELIKIDKDIPIGQYSMEEAWEKEDDWAIFLMNIEPTLEDYKLRQINILSETDFFSIDAPIRDIFVGISTDFFDYLSEWEKIEQYQKEKEYPDSIKKFVVYEVDNAFYQILHLLSILVASTLLLLIFSILIFKILSDMSLDKQNYQILYALGCSNQQKNRAIFLELGTIFVLPFFLAICHLYFCLPLLFVLISDPYEYLLAPSLLFLILYGFLYVFSVCLYINGLNKNRE